MFPSSGSNGYIGGERCPEAKTKQGDLEKIEKMIVGDCRRKLPKVLACTVKKDVAHNVSMKFVILHSFQVGWWGYTQRSIVGAIGTNEH